MELKTGRQKNFLYQVFCKTNSSVTKLCHFLLFLKVFQQVPRKRRKDNYLLFRNFVKHSKEIPKHFTMCVIFKVCKCGAQNFVKKKPAFEIQIFDEYV